MSTGYNRLHEKFNRRYISNRQRSINALREIVNEAPKLLVALESGHHYRTTEVDRICDAAEKLKMSYIHVVEYDNFIRAIEFIEGHDDEPTDNEPD